MTDIEVVREAHNQGVDCTYLAACPVCIALDALETELAQAKAGWDDAQERVYRLNPELSKLRAELAQVREERDHNARTAVDLDRQLAQAKQRINDPEGWEDELRRALAKAREERDAAREAALMVGNDLRKQRDRAARYREALERIAALKPEGFAETVFVTPGINNAHNIARAALTGETTDA